MARPALLFTPASLMTVSAVVTSAAFRLARRSGLPWDAQLGVRLRGQSLEGVAALLGSHAGLPESAWPELEAALRDEFRERIDAHPLHLQPGLETLLLQVAIAEVKIGVVSTLNANDLASCLDKTGLRDDLDEIRCSTAGDPPGSTPDLYRALAADLGTDSSSCVAVEHTTAGIKAAEAAGLRAFGDPTLRTTRGAGLVDSYAERNLLARLFADERSLHRV